MSNIFKILRLSKPILGLFYLVTTLIVLGTLLQQAVPIFSKFVIDEIEAQIRNGTGDLSRIYLFIGIGFGISLASISINSISQRLGDEFGGRIRKFLIEKFYDHILRLPQSYFDTEVSGKIVNQLNRGVWSTEGFMKSMTNFILPTLLQAIITVSILLYYNFKVGLFILVLFPIYFTLSYYSSKKWGKREIEKNSLEDFTRGRIQEVIANIKLVKGFASQVMEFKSISEAQKDINIIYAEQSRTFHIFDFFRNLTLISIILIVNIIIFVSAFNGNVSIGEMVLIITLVAQVQRPLFVMSYMLTQIQSTESGTKEFFEILDLEEVERYEAVTTVDNNIRPIIEFKDVEFSYEDGGRTLHDVNFTIGKNEKVALVGPSGAGKTTITNLIMKFYKPTKGTITLNGEDYSNIGHNQIRSLISLVFQENELFSTTIKANVAYGGEYKDEDIIESLKKANAWGFVSKLPKGIDTEVGERGIKLSGGQKQRIQIARAILKDSPIVILDEATSNLDSKSEADVQEAMNNLVKDKMVIIIAHRFSTIQNVDRVFVLDKGNIIDSGHPSELAKREGIYKTLLDYQISGNKKLVENYELH